MSTINNKNYSSPRNINLKEGCLRFGGTQSSSPFDSTSNGLYINASNQLVFSSQGSDTTVGAAGGGTISTWDTLYDNDKTLAIDGTTLTFDISTNVSGLTLSKSGTGAGAPLVIANSGTGNDITGPAWSIISTGSVGILELTSGGTINATGGALTIGSSGTATTFAGTVTVTTSTTITGAADSTCLTVTAGDISIANGKIVQVNDDTDTALGITADAVTTGKAIDVNADACTSGSVLHLDVVDGAGFTGSFIDCYNNTASVFNVKRYGAVTIAGNAATNVFTITAGDVVLSDASVTITDADNAASFSLTNNTATSASVFVLAGSGAFTGNTTSSFATITASGLTTGTALYLPLAAMTTGKGLHIAADAMTTGSAIYVDQDGEALAAGELLTIVNTESGDISATPKTGNLCSLTSSVTATTSDTTLDYDALLISRSNISGTATKTLTASGSVLKLMNTSTNTAGTCTDSTVILEVLGVDGGTAAPTGDAVKVTSVGVGAKAINVVSASTSVSDVLVTGSGAKANNKACIEATNNAATAAGGSILRVANTGTPAAATSYLVDFDYSGATMTNNPAGIFVNVGTTTNNGVEINGSGATASTKGLLAVLPAGNTAAGGAGLAVIAGASTPAAATSYLVNFNYSAATMTNNPITMIVNSGSSTAAGIQITGSGAPATGNLQIASTATGALGAVINFDQTANSAAASDVIARMLFTAQDVANAAETYGRIDCIIRDTTAANPDASLVFLVDRAGTVTKALEIGWDVTAGAAINGIMVGDGAGTAIVSSVDAYDLTLSTNGGTNSGTITITDAANGDITLTPNGTGNTVVYAPTWIVTNKTSTATLTVAEGGVITCDTTGGAFTITLPAVANNAGLWYCFKKTDVAANAVTIDGNGSETIDGATTNAAMDAQYDTITIVCNGTAWFITSYKVA